MSMFKVITERMNSLSDKTIATDNEVIKYLTSVLRGETETEHYSDTKHCTGERPAKSH